MAKAKVSKFKKDKFYPLVKVTLDDMSYGEKTDSTIGWICTRRAKKVQIQENMSAVENDGVELGDKYIPLNTRWVKSEYKDNKSIVY